MNYPRIKAVAAFNAANTNQEKYEVLIKHCNLGLMVHTTGGIVQIWSLDDAKALENRRHPVTNWVPYYDYTVAE